MATNGSKMSRKTVVLIIVIALCVLVTAGAVTWFVVVPNIVDAKLDDAFKKLQTKTERHLEIANVSLKSPRHITLTDIGISEPNDPQNQAITIDQVDLKLANIPGLGDLRLSEINVGDVSVHVTRDNDKTNFDDIIQALRPKNKADNDNDSENDETSEPPAWKKYITPYPDVTLNQVQITMPELALTPSLAVTGVAAKDIQITWDEVDGENMLVMHAKAATALRENGTETTYQTSIRANVVNAQNGTIELSLPKSTDDELPDVFSPGNFTVNAQKVVYTLPTTFEIIQPVLKHGETSIFEARNARIRLMSMPPQKVSGIWIKEFELTNPAIHAEFTDDGNDFTDLMTTLRSTLSKQAPKIQKADAQPQDGEGDTELAQNAETEIVPEQTAPKPASKNLRDYYFAQRFFVNDGSIILHDARQNPRGDIHIDQITLESGYRSIRKLVDFNIVATTSAPFDTNIALKGEYGLKSEQLSANVDLRQFRSNASTLTMQHAVRALFNITPPPEPEPPRAAGPTPTDLPNGISRLPARLPKPAPVPVPPPKLSADQQTPFDRVMRIFDFDQTDITGNASLNADFKAKTATVNADWKTRGVAIFSPIISTEPFSLDHEAHLEIGYNGIEKPVVEVKKFDITREQATMSLTGTFAQETTTLDKAKPTENNTFDTLGYDFTLSLPLQDAMTIFNATPHALRTELDGMTASGQIGFDLTVKGKLSAIDETQHKFVLNQTPDFAIQRWPANRNLTDLNHGFLYHVNDPNAVESHDITIPPSIYPVLSADIIQRIPSAMYAPGITNENIRSRFPNWVTFEDLNPWLVQLITTTEDGNFFTHEGFSPLQIKAALAKNVKRGEFNRGASTISMQLIKNLFFERHKTLARKAQEALYTWLMESYLHIPKQRIMEIYFNIIEFGPELYGIEEASKYYFGKRSDALTLNEAAFLIAIIPGPRKGESYRSKGEITSYLQKTVGFYIREMYRRKCAPETIKQMHARFAKKNQPVPFEPCCPTQADIELMQQQPIKFYLPDPSDPLKYGYDPSLYYSDGTPIYPVHRSCGYNAEAAQDAMDALSAIFEEYND